MFTSKAEFLRFDGILPRKLLNGYPSRLKILYTGLKHWEVPLLVSVTTISRKHGIKLAVGRAQNEWVLPWSLLPAAVARRHKTNTTRVRNCRQGLISGKIVN